jgi:group I intron endonuclease
MTAKEAIDIVIGNNYTTEELNSKCGVYIITINNKHYLGSCKLLNNKTSRDGFHYRLYAHLYKLLKGNHHSLKLQNAFNKHSVTSIEFDIIDECPTEITTEIEQYWLNILDTFRKGYNSCPLAKSNFGFKWSKESREKLSASKKGKVPWNKGIKTFSPSEETRKKLSSATKGRLKGPMSEKQKEDIRQTLLKRNAELKNLLTLS